jgi:Histidine kinase-, DNA gyrase B-, and HSP90-like ATPase
MTKIDITPDVSLIQKAGAVNYKIPQALAEFPDNSIDDRIDGKKVTVEITVGQRAGKKRIVIADDAKGMTEDELSKAMIMAHSKKGHDEIGKFGLGMKTACSFLGSKFTIVTATKSAKKALRLVYDEEKFIESREWNLDIEEIEKPFKHGTVIEIEDLKVNLYAGVKDAVLSKFSKTFKHFVAAGDVEILVNGDAVVPHIPDTLKKYDTELRFEVNGKPIRGWVSLASKGSGKGQYGFDLVRHNRVLCEHEKIGFAASPATTRVIGELQLDDFPVVNNKTDFRRDTKDWDALQRALKEQIIDIARESRRLANPGKALEEKDKAELKEHMDLVQDALKSDDLQADLDRRALDADLADEFEGGGLPFELPANDSEIDGESNREGKRETSTVTRNRLNRVKTQLRNLAIEHSVAKLGKGSLYKIWEIEGVGANKRLVVTTNADHAMYMATRDSFMLWMKHNIVEAVSEFFTQETGKTDAMLLIKSDILKHISQMQLELDEDTSGMAEEDLEATETVVA